MLLVHWAEKYHEGMGVEQFGMLKARRGGGGGCGVLEYFVISEAKGGGLNGDAAYGG